MTQPPIPPTGADLVKVISRTSEESTMYIGLIAFDLGRAGAFTLRQLYDAVAARAELHCLGEKEEAVVRKAIALAARDPRMPIVRTGDSPRSGLYRNVTSSEQLTDAKRAQPFANRTRKITPTPPPLMKRRGKFGVGSCLVVIEVKDDLALVRCDDDGHVYRVVLERVL